MRKPPAEVPQKVINPIRLQSRRRRLVANFLKCHVSLIRLRDKAREMEILQSVRDEGQFWEHRDIAALLKLLHMWNGKIAGFHGILRDAIEAAGGDPRTLSAEISKFPDFEHLESKKSPPIHVTRPQFTTLNSRRRLLVNGRRFYTHRLRGRIRPEKMLRDSP